MRRTNEKLTVSKMEAAQRQLRTAIELWFKGGDPVSTHTLAWASHEIIHTLFRRRGFSGLLFDTDIIKDEYRTEYGRWMSKSATFFKHARADPDANDEFDPNRNEALLVASLMGLQKMGEQFGDAECALYFWLTIEHPNWFIENPSGPRLPAGLREKIRKLEKATFSMPTCWSVKRVAPRAAADANQRQLRHAHPQRHGEIDNAPRANRKSGAAP